MPSESKAQHRFFGKAKSDPEFARRKGISQALASEYLKADKGKVKRLPERKKKNKA
jgi:predicted transcriptional regulator